MTQAETIGVPPKAEILREIKAYVASIKSVLSEVNTTVSWEDGLSDGI